MKPRIVIVERRTDAAEALWKSARENGFQPDVVFDFDSATRKLTEARLPDALLLSSTRDERINLSFVRTIRCTARLRNLPVFIVVSARKNSYDAAMKAGATDCVSAPCQSGELFARIKTALRLRPVVPA